MTDKLTIALAQLNPTVGDVKGNLKLIKDAVDRSKTADLILFSELVMSGYSPEDLVLKPFFQEKVEEAVLSLAKETKNGGPALLLPAPWRVGGALHNAVLLLDEGIIKTVRLKHDLPNYGVFDEKRVFAPGPMPGPINFRDVRLGVPICEDIWTPDVVECLQESGADILLVPNGSPFESDKIDHRLNHAVARVKESGLPLVYLNQIGGQDELVFDGASFVLNGNGEMALQLPSWQEAVVITEWKRDGDIWCCLPGKCLAPDTGVAAIYQAMVLGLRDYVNKAGFPGVLLGLSGGIDSALSAAVAVDALGSDRVHCVMMPSPYTSKESLEDASEAAALMGIRYDTVSIKPAMLAFDEMLSPLFENLEADVTEENIQARSRGLLLMSISNKFGHMLLTTGNKSEMAVGYSTLYGDMSGGYSVLKDVYKTDVFKACQWRNDNFSDTFFGPRGRVIPKRIISKPPSAELKPGQTDQDTLPPYDELDDILVCLIEGEMGVNAIVSRGHQPETVQRVWRMLDGAEYKRRQAPPGVKITSRAFGRDRRYPITNSFRNIL